MTINWTNRKRPVMLWQNNWYESDAITKHRLRFLRPTLTPGVKERVVINTTGSLYYATLEIGSNVNPFWYDDWNSKEIVVVERGESDAALTRFWETEDFKDMIKYLEYYY